MLDRHHYYAIIVSLNREPQMSNFSVVNMSLITVSDKTVWATPQQCETLKTLTDSRKGGFARVIGYKPTSGYVTPPVVDMTVTTRFSYQKLIERQAAIIETITFEQAEPYLVKANVNVTDTDLFEQRKAMMLASIKKTTDGDRSDAMRAAHDRCYINFADGVTVHLRTEKVDGIMQPVLQAGSPVIDSIMLNVLEVSRTVRQAGERKIVKSGVPVLISNAIDKVARDSGVRQMKRIALKDDNFESLKIDGETITPDDIIGLQ